MKRTIIVALPVLAALAVIVARRPAAYACSCTPGQHWVLELTEVTVDGVATTTESYGQVTGHLSAVDDSHAQFSADKGKGNESFIQFVRR